MSTKLPVHKSKILYKSSAEPYVWGLSKIVCYVNCKYISHFITLASSLFAFEENVSYAISLLTPTIFQKCLCKYTGKKLKYHVDVIISTSSSDKTIHDFLTVVLKDFRSKSIDSTPVHLKFFFDNNDIDAFYPDDQHKLDTILLANNFIKKFSNCRKVECQLSVLSDETIFDVRKEYVLYQTWKADGKQHCAVYGGYPLLNLIGGVLISQHSINLYENLLFQCVFVGENKSPLNGKRKDHETLKKLSLSNRNVAHKLTQYTASLSVDADGNIFNATTNFFIRSCLQKTDTHESVINATFYLFRSSAAFFQDVADTYSAVSLFLRYHKNGYESSLDIVRRQFSSIEGQIQVMLRKEISCKYRWLLEIIDSNLKFLRQKCVPAESVHDIISFIEIEEVSALTASLLMIPYVAYSCKPLLDLFVNSEEHGRNVSNVFGILSGEFLGHQTDGSKVRKLFFDDAINKINLHGLSLSNLSKRMQSVAKMESIAALLQYQSDIHIDTTLENSLNRITLELSPNPYNTLAYDSIVSSYKVYEGVFSNSSIASNMSHKPRRHEGDHYVFSVGGKIYGLHHAIIQSDIEGLDYVLEIGHLVKNSTGITKKDGIRITTVIVPYYNHILTGKVTPFLYTFRCEEYYAIILENKGAEIDSAFNFLSEILVSNLISLAVAKAVILSYKVNDDENIINMQQLLSKTFKKQSFTQKLCRILKNRNRITFQFLVRTIRGSYVRVYKDIKPILVDRDTNFYDHLTPLNPLNLQFPIFHKLHPANFFFGYVEGSPSFDTSYAIRSLDRMIATTDDFSETYKYIQLKHMLNEDTSFIATAVRMSHTPYMQLICLQQENILLQDILEVFLLNENSRGVDEDTLKDMIADHVSNVEQRLRIIGVQTNILKVINDFLFHISKSSMITKELLELIKKMSFVLNFLTQFYERELRSCSGTQLKKALTYAKKEAKYMDLSDSD